MIEHLQLARWRAFDAVTLDFGPGTTFIVAPNGVGKTSLLLGMTWALFGEHSRVDAASCVRLGADDAETIVTVRLQDETRLVISRQVTIAGKITQTFKHADREVTAERANALLVGEFGAPLDVAARLAVVRGAGREEGELDLREHLYDTFGVTELRRAATKAAQLAKDAVNARKRVRSAAKAQLGNRSQLEAAAEQLERDLEHLNERRALLTQDVAAAEHAQRALQAWSRYQEATALQATQIAELLTRVDSDGFAAATLPELSSAIGARVEQTNESLAAARDALAHAQAQELAAQSALALLSGHEPECPTCARPFHGEELARSIAVQRASAQHAQGRIEQATAAIESGDAELQRLQSLRSDVDRLEVGVQEPDVDVPGEDPDAQRAAAEQALREHDELAGSVSRERAVIIEQLEADSDARAAQVAEQTAYRREALTLAVAAALNATARRVATEHIEPLSRQVRWRWKALFGEDGLQLRPDGKIVRVVKDRELRWEHLSGGEQIWARLVASLLILQSSTTVPFAWLDEPLEHLDPRARRIVARDLAVSTRSGAPAQLVVTTYEHTLAAQLAGDVPEASIRFLNRTPDAVTRARAS
jgi:hypothetical protein